MTVVAAALINAIAEPVVVLIALQNIHMAWSRLHPRRFTLLDLHRRQAFEPSGRPEKADPNTTGGTDHNDHDTPQIAA